MLRKLGKSNQIAIPKEIVVTLGLKQDDLLDVYVQDNRIVIEPKIIVPKDQAYFYTPEWQRDERAADEDIRKGRITKTRNVKQLLREMDT